VGLRSFNIETGKTKLKKFKESICESVMKSRFICPCKTPIQRFDAVDFSFKVQTLSTIKPAVPTLTHGLSRKVFNQGGC
jgi:hypothetical protein